MKIGLASDHRGYRAKEMLKEYLDDYNIIDYGTDSDESTDFPIYATRLGKAIVNHDVDLGIAICGTGIGMSIALNKIKGVYCAKVSNISEAVLCRQHNDANAISFSADMGIDLAKEIVDKFIETPFSKGEKYIRRNKMIRDREKNG